MDQTHHNIEVGDFALVRFAVEPPVDECTGERMWVEITDLSDAHGCLRGKLDNDPVVRTDLKCGQSVIFELSAVINITPASKVRDAADASIEKDELGDRRKTNTQREVLQGIGEEMMSGAHIEDFGQWLLTNMPAHEFTHHAHSFVGGLTGHLIDTWLQSGATPEMLKEYFARFVDMQVEQRKRVEKLFPDGGGPCDHK